MAAIDSETWRMNIENAADEVRSHYGNETVESIFRSYEVTCFDDLNPSDYERIFSDFQQLINVKLRWTCSALNLNTVGVQLEHRRRLVPCFVVCLVYLMRECLFR